MDLCHTSRSICTSSFLELATIRRHCCSRFVQTTEDVVRYLFNVDVPINSNFSHGFISDEKACILPANFCELGIARFKQDLQRLNFISDLIIDSLKMKIEKLKDKRLVLPPSLDYLITDWPHSITPRKSRCRTGWKGSFIHPGAW